MFCSLTVSEELGSHSDERLPSEQKDVVGKDIGNPRFPFICLSCPSLLFRAPSRSLSTRTKIPLDRSSARNALSCKECSAKLRSDTAAQVEDGAEEFSILGVDFPKPSLHIELSVSLTGVVSAALLTGVIDSLV